MLHDAVEDDVKPGILSEEKSVDKHEEHSENEAGSHVKRCCHGDTLGKCGQHCKEETDIPEQKLCEDIVQKTLTGFLRQNLKK